MAMMQCEYDEGITRKSYTVTGGGTRDYLYVYRIGDIRIISAHLPAAQSGTEFCQLDSIDRPYDDTYFNASDWTNKLAYCLKIETNGKVKQSGSSNTGGATSGEHVNGTYTVKVDTTA